MRREAILLLGLLAFCLALRTAQLLAWPIFIDESLHIRAAQLMDIRTPATLLMSESADYSGDPPLYAWLMAPLLHLLADPLLAARLTSALIGALGLPWTWAAARMLWGPRTGLAAALLYALCPFLLFYHRMALHDGLIATCGAGALYYAIRLACRGRMRDALTLGLCLAAALLTKAVAVSLLLLPLLAVVAAHSGERRAVARGAAVAMVLGAAPYTCLALWPYDNTPYSFVFHGHLQVAGGVEGLLSVIGGQAARWANALWLYLTPPVLLLAALGLWATRRERMALLLGAWALLGSLPVVALPNRLFVPRYFLYIAVPTVVLAARGLLLLADLARTRLTAGRPRPLLLSCAVGLILLPAIASDAAIIAASTRTPLLPADRFQYVTGWPSGYMLTPMVGFLRGRARRGPITVVSEQSNPPLDMLRIALVRDTSITLVEASVDSPRDLGAGLRQAVRGTDGNAGSLYLIVHYTSDRPSPIAPDGAMILANRGTLRLVLRARSLDEASRYDVYTLVGPSYAI